MKLTKYISAIFIFGCLTGFTYITNRIYIYGQLVDTGNEKGTSKVSIVIKADQRVLTTAKTNRKGAFKITFTPQNESYFDFFYVDPTQARDTLFLRSFTRFESDILKIQFSIPNEYKKTKDGGVHCPKCNFTDKVYRIVYGDGAIRSVVINGDSTWTNIFDEEKIYYANNCKVGMAAYYCKRDNIKF